jgi:L-lactate dehydrogenase complex protein LldF
MLLALRGAATADHLLPASMAAAMRAFAFVASRPALYRTMTRFARAVLRGRSKAGWIGKLPGMAAGWTRSRDLRAPAATTFQDRWRSRTAGRPS